MVQEGTDRTLTICSWVFVAVAAIVAIQGALDGLPRHGVDVSWPSHARFHVTYATFSRIGFCVMTATVALIPFRRSERWSWWVLAGFFVFGNLSLIPATLWQGSGPQSHFLVPIFIAYASVFGALVASRRVGLQSTAGKQSK